MGQSIESKGARMEEQFLNVRKKETRVLNTFGKVQGKHAF
jgi:hypothetical protein